MPKNMTDAGMTYGKGGSTYGKGGSTHKAKCGKMGCGGSVTKIINGASLRPKG